MSSEHLPITDLSPLDQIRHAEAEAARQVVLAKSAADRDIERSRQKAVELVEEARREGMRDGLAEQKILLAEANKAAEESLAATRRHVKNIHSLKGEVIETAVDEVLRIILGKTLERKP
jgi:vacuolar-type H+-ATPase subunit H